MGLVTIRIADKVQQYSTFENGMTVYKAVRRELDQGNQVALSFNSIMGVPSSFVNGLFSKLIDEVGVLNTKKNIKIVDSTSLINDMIKRKFSLAS